jgi:DnaJ family protein A protein 2
LDPVYNLLVETSLHNPSPQVDFPDTLTEEEVSTLRSALPASTSTTNQGGSSGSGGAPDANGATPSAMEDDDAEECTMAVVPDIQRELEGRAHLGRGSGNAYDSEDDDDDHPRGQRVQCAQQ